MTSNTTKQDALLDELRKGYTNPKDLLGEHGLLKQLTRRLVERALEAEMTAHLGYARHAPEGRGSGNSRNGKSAKTIQTETGPLVIEVPRDRNGAFEPQLVAKRQRLPAGRPARQADWALDRVLRSSPGDPQSAVCHQRHRITQLQPAQAAQDPRRVSER